MQFRTRLGGVAAAVLTATGLVVGAGVLAAGPASAAPDAIVDQSLQANTPFDTNSVQAGDPSGTESTSASVPVTCSGLFMNGQPLSVSPVTEQDGLTASFPTGTHCNGGGTLTLAHAGTLNDGTFQWVVSASPNPDHNAVEKAVVNVIVAGGVIDQVWTENVTINSPPNTVLPNIKFTGKDIRFCEGFEGNQGASGEPTDPCGYSTTTPFPAVNTGTTPVVTALDGTWANTDLPGSLNFSSVTSGLLVPGGSGCGSSSCEYNFATVSGSQGGATASETFDLTVLTSHVIVQSNIGDYVNPFGNGIDVFQQHYVGNTLIVGWTATKGDPATHFVREINSHGGFSLEAVRANGIASGLCLSDPIGSEPAGFAVGQLTLRGCNGSVFQGFTPANTSTPGALNSDTGAGHVEPNGTGNPLIVKTAFDGWGGFNYVWMDLAQLP